MLTRTVPSYIRAHAAKHVEHGHGLKKRKNHDSSAVSPSDTRPLGLLAAAVLMPMNGHCSSTPDVQAAGLMHEHILCASLGCPAFNVCKYCRSGFEGCLKGWGVRLECKRGG